MASSVILCGPTISEPLSRTTFIASSSFSFVHSPRCRNGLRRYGCSSPIVAKSSSFDHIPKHFRYENLKDGLKENYKDASRFLYGLTPSQLDMFMTKDSAVRRQSESVTEESLSSAYSYLNKGGMWNMSATTKRSMSAGAYRGGVGRGRRTSPPDLASLMLDNRVVYLGLPLVPAVTQLICAEFMWLDFEDQSKPIYLYINCSGTQNEKSEIVGAETDAFAIADCMALCKSDVYTVNISEALGQAAMLLSLGKKGHRGILPHASTALHLPKASNSSGVATDMWNRARELDANTEYYLELLSKGTGKSKEELKQFMRRKRALDPQEAIEFGVVDRVIETKYEQFEKQNTIEGLPQSRALPEAGRAGDQPDQGPDISRNTDGL